MLTVLFRSARDAVRAEKACREDGLTVTVTPPPAHLSAECGMAFRLGAKDASRFEKLMNNNEITFIIHGTE